MGDPGAKLHHPLEAGEVGRPVDTTQTNRKML